jgi:cyanophycinase
MARPDLRALDLAGGPNALVSIIPAAAAPDHNHIRAGQNGVRWFEGLGATRVSSLPLIDRDSANSEALVRVLKDSRLIYLLGGFPDYLAQTLRDSLCWRAIMAALQAGAVIAGSSAGAMVVCEHYYDPATQSIKKGLDLIPGTCLIPHYDTFGRDWMARLAKEHPEMLCIGIDEETGMINEGPQGQWLVYGKGAVTLCRDHQFRSYSGEEAFSL